MNGTLIPHTPIAVDFWKVRECPQARIFLLTHLHGDHVAGLTSTWSYPIYCSEITGKLLVCRFEIKRELIHTLEIGSAQIVYLDKEHREQMTLTALDANHCPGAVMFLMEGYFGTILHTGDFRFQPDMIQRKPLVDYAEKIDVLYLDNTYCSPSCQFPSREEATDRIIEIIQSHPTHNIVFGLRSLGKENLLLTIAQHFQEFVSVSSQMFETLQILEAPDVFVVESEECRFQVKPFHSISNKFVARLNEVSPTIVILPTSIYCGIDARPYENQDSVFIVPYSDHSSYTELEQFVSFIRPGKIIPIVKGRSRGPFGLSIADRADMSQFQACIGCGWNKLCDVPTTVKMYMLAVADKQGDRGGKKRKHKSTKSAGPSKKMKRGVIFDSPIQGQKSKELTLQKENRKSGTKSKSTRDLFGESKVKTLSPYDKSKSISPQNLRVKVSPKSIKRRESKHKHVKRQDVKLKELGQAESIGPPIGASSPLEKMGKLTTHDKVKNWLSSLDYTIGSDILNQEVNKNQTGRKQNKHPEDSDLSKKSPVKSRCKSSYMGELKSANNSDSEMTKHAGVEMDEVASIENNADFTMSTANYIGIENSKDTTSSKPNRRENKGDLEGDYFVSQASQGFQVNHKGDMCDESFIESVLNLDEVKDSPVQNVLIEDCTNDSNSDGLERITDSFYRTFENEVNMRSSDEIKPDRQSKLDQFITVNGRKGNCNIENLSDQSKLQSVERVKPVTKNKRTLTISIGKEKLMKRNLEMFPSQTKLRLLASQQHESQNESNDETTSQKSQEEVDITNCLITSDSSSVTTKANEDELHHTHSMSNNPDEVVNNTEDHEASHEEDKTNSDKDSDKESLNTIQEKPNKDPEGPTDFPQYNKGVNAYENYRHLHSYTTESQKQSSRETLRVKHKDDSFLDADAFYSSIVTAGKKPERLNRESKYFNNKTRKKRPPINKISKYFTNKQNKQSKPNTMNQKEDGPKVVVVDVDSAKELTDDDMSEIIVSFDSPVSLKQKRTTQSNIDSLVTDSTVTDLAVTNNVSTNSALTGNVVTANAVSESVVKDDIVTDRAVTEKEDTDSAIIAFLVKESTYTGSKISNECNFGKNKTTDHNLDNTDENDSVIVLSDSAGSLECDNVEDKERDIGERCGLVETKSFNKPKSSTYVSLVSYLFDNTCSDDSESQGQEKDEDKNTSQEYNETNDLDEDNNSYPLCQAYIDKLERCVRGLGYYSCTDKSVKDQDKMEGIRQSCSESKRTVEEFCVKDSRNSKRNFYQMINQIKF